MATPTFVQPDYPAQSREAPLPNPERLTVTEAAAQVGVAPKTIRRWIKRGRLAAELTRGPYGETYAIDREAMQLAHPHAAKRVSAEIARTATRNMGGV